MSMATRARTYSQGSSASKALLHILLASVIYLLGLPISGVAFAAHMQVRDPTMDSHSNASQHKGDTPSSEEPDRQRLQETWSAHYQKQDEVYAAEEADFQRSREAWTARYQIQ
jgi:hypothetical protein